jgi:hypothetical protein
MAKQGFTEEGLRGNPASEPKTIQEAAHDVPGAPPHYPEHVRITQEESEGKELTAAERAQSEPTTVTGLSPEEEAEAFADKRPVEELSGVERRNAAEREREAVARATAARTASKPGPEVDVKKSTEKK